MRLLTCSEAHNTVRQGQAKHLAAHPIEADIVASRLACFALCKEAIARGE